MNRNAGDLGEEAKASARAYLATFQEEEFDRRVAEFRSRNVSTASTSDISRQILDVLSFDNRYVAFVRTKTYRAGTLFWRGRYLGTERTLPHPSMNRTSDAWEPPAEFVKSRGRLNKAGESLLYTSVGSPGGVAAEARVPGGEKFALIKYEAVADVGLTVLASDDAPEFYTEEERAKVRRIGRFLQEELFKPADEQLSVYAVSETITKDLFDGPPAFQDGWGYASVLRPRIFNAAFRAEKAHEKLRLVGVCIAESSAFGGLKGYAFTDGLESPSGLRWEGMGGPIQTSRFPDFGL